MESKFRDRYRPRITKIQRSLDDGKSNIGEADIRCQVCSTIGSKRIRSGVAVRIRSHLHTIDRYPAAGRPTNLHGTSRYRHRGVLMTDGMRALGKRCSLEKRRPRSISTHRAV